MAIETDNLRFEVPKDFVDTTPYQFAEFGEDDEPLALVIVSEDPVGNTDIPAEMIEGRAARAQAIHPGGVTVERETDRIIAGQKGRTAEVSHRGGPGCGHDYWAAFVGSGWEYLVSFAPAKSRAATEAMFNRMVDSCVIGDGAAATATPTGYVRRRTRRLALDVPEAMDPPSRYAMSHLHSKCSLVLTVLRRPEDEPTLDELIKEDEAQHGTLQERRGVDVAVADATGRAEQYVVTRRRGDELVRRAELRMKQGAQLQLQGRAPRSDAGALERGWDALCRSIRAR